MTEEPMCYGNMRTALTNVCGKLLGRVHSERRDLQDGLAVRLHGRSGNGAQPVISHVVQLRHLISCTEHSRELSALPPALAAFVTTF